MLKRLNELNFVIGVFFILVSLILFGDRLVSKGLSGTLNLYTAVIFLIFGVLMVVIKKKPQ
jgi:hypothetical protein